MKIYPQILGINANFHSFSLRRGEAYRVLSYPCFLNQWLFSQEFPMGLRRTKMDENNATIFHSYPCFFLSVFPLSVAIFTGVPTVPTSSP